MPVDSFVRPRPAAPRRPAQTEAASPRRGLDESTPDRRVERLQSRALEVAEREHRGKVREHGGDNTGPRVEQYRRAVQGSGGGDWCGHFVGAAYAEVARAEGGRVREPGKLNSLPKARAHFTYTTRNEQTHPQAGYDALREQHAREGSARRYMVLEGSRGYDWATRQGRSAEVYTPRTLPLRPGDVVLFEGPGHLGMVKSYDQGTGMLTTIEGNIGKPGQGRVIERTYDLNTNRWVSGFGRPANADFELPTPGKGQ